MPDISKFHKVKSALPIDDLKLIVQFACGVTKEYDVSPLLTKWPAFQTLKNTPELFNCVKVDAEGYGIYWNDDIDLSCNELWENGKQINKETPNQETIETLEEALKGENLSETFDSVGELMESLNS